MATKTFKVSLSLDNPRIIQSGINVHSFDKQSIKITIELTKNSQVYQIPTGAQIKISLLKLARQEQKIILDVPFTSADSIDWIVPDYLDGYQGEVRVGVYLIVGTENIDVGYFNITSSVSDIDSAAEEFTESVLQGWAIEDLTALLPKFQAVLDETTGKDVISAPEIILARGGAQTLGERLEEDKAEVTAQLAQKANQDDLVIERARIDSLSTLSEGSTTGDAELIDARIGADGVTYNNAGGAIRGQIGKINNDLVAHKLDYVQYKTNITEPTSKQLFNKDRITEKYVVTDTGIFEPNVGWSISDYIKIKPATNYYSRYNKTIRVAWFDKDFIFISRFNGETNLMVSPVNARYCIFVFNVGIQDVHMLQEGTSHTGYETYKEKLTNSDPLYKIISTLPPKIYSVAGKELNIYFDNIFLSNISLDNFSFDVVCAIGNQFKEKWRTATTTHGNYPLTIKVLIDGYIEVARATTEIVIVPATAKTGENMKVLMVGDSVTDGGVITDEMINLFGNDVADITLLGTRGNTPNLHEGRSGWTIGNYAVSADYGGLTNPFYNPSTTAFDLAYYMSNQGYANIDYLIFNLGINNVMAYLTTSPVARPDFTNFENMIANAKVYNPNIKIGISVIIPPGNQDGFGKVYGSGFNIRQYKQNYFEFCNALIEDFTGRENENIYLVPINTNLDVVYGYPTETITVNSRSTDTIKRQIDAIHPNNNGKYQIADVFYYFIKAS